MIHRTGWLPVTSLAMLVQLFGQPHPARAQIPPFISFVALNSPLQLTEGDTGTLYFRVENQSITGITVSLDDIHVNTVSTVSGTDPADNLTRPVTEEKASPVTTPTEPTPNLVLAPGVRQDFSVPVATPPPDPPTEKIDSGDNIVGLSLTVTNTSTNQSSTGSISAHVIVADAPEPSTTLMAGTLVCAGLALRWLPRRRDQRRQRPVGQTAAIP